jgi:hypothetical protein
LACIAIYQREYFATSSDIGTLFFICASYGFAMLPFIYAFSYLFEKHSTGENMLSLLSFVGEFLNYLMEQLNFNKINILAGLFYGVYTIANLSLEHSKWKFLVDILYWISLTIAPFNLVEQLTRLGFSFISGQCETYFLLNFFIDN